MYNNFKKILQLLHSLHAYICHIVTYSSKKFEELNYNIVVVKRYNWDFFLHSVNADSILYSDERLHKS